MKSAYKRLNTAASLKSSNSYVNNIVTWRRTPQRKCHHVKTMPADGLPMSLHGGSRLTFHQWKNMQQSGTKGSSDVVLMGDALPAPAVLARHGSIQPTWLTINLLTSKKVAFGIHCLHVSIRLQVPLAHTPWPEPKNNFIFSNQLRTTAASFSLTFSKLPAGTYSRLNRFSSSSFSASADGMRTLT